jgi:methyl-accepting chemotaxis protein
VSETPEVAPYAIRRRRLLVDKPFQYRLLKLVTALWLSQTLFFTLVIYYFYQGHILRFYHLVPRRAVEPLLSLASLFSAAVAGVALFSLVMALVVGIYLSHQIAGPLYRLRLSLQRVAQGDYGFEIRFREKDFLEDLPADFNRLVQALRQREEADLAGLDEVERAFAEPATARSRLSELRSEKARRMQGAGEVEAVPLRRG